MSSIRVPTISSPSLNSVSGIGKAPSTMSAFTVGEIVEALIVEKASPFKYLLALKHQKFLADSGLSLKAGEKLMVKVEQLKPQIVLRIVDREASSSSFANDYLRIYRANPHALMDIFKTGQNIFNQESLMELLPETTRENIRNVLRIMDSLIYSQDSLKNPLFLKDYVSCLGLMMEYGLMKFLQGKKDTKNMRPAEDLKGALVKLSEELRTLVTDGKFMEQDDVQKLVQLAEFTETSAKAIETQQMINIIFQEHDDKYALQLPFLFPNGIGTGEIFIETEKGKGNESGGNRRRVVIFLSMDALGDIMVDATMKGNKLGCALKFEDHEARVFCSSFLGELENIIRLSGYEWEYLTCITENKLVEAREEYHRQLMRNHDAVNLFA